MPNPSQPPFKVSPPPSAQPNPEVPSDFEPLVFEEFAGIDTTASRYGLDPRMMPWCDGWMPFGPKRLRTMPGVGSSIWTAPSGGSIAFFDFANIGSNPIMIGVHSDGGLWQINTQTKAATRMAADGTIKTPERTAMAISQWGNQYVLIVAQQTNGYFIWDGSIFYQAGSLGPVVTVTNGGSGYTNPTITASGGSGSGASFQATVASGVITAIAVTNPGSGYVAGDTVSLNITDSTGSSATATVTLMPFAIEGNAIETYVGRVWIANGATVTFSAPGSYIDFSSGSGGGNFTSSDSFLRVRFTQLKQTNGFLYLIGDSSINYISGVNTAGTPPVTTFSNQNADPETGTVWPASVDVFGRNIVFANAFGAQISYGAAVSKISEPLDGVYATVNNFGGLIPSAAKAIIYGKRCWCLLLPVIDPVTGNQKNKIFLWNGKIWWSTSQDVELLYIQHQEIDSVLTAYGTDGTDVYPLFQQPSAVFTKTVQSKLWGTPGGYRHTKATSRLWAIFYFIGSSQITIDISIDNEQSNAVNTATYTSPQQTILVKNASSTTIPVKNASSTTILTKSILDGIWVLPPTAVGQQGALLGLTFQTTTADMQIWSAALAPEIVQYRG